MITKEDLAKEFGELEDQKNAIITRQIKINGKIELLDELAKEGAPDKAVLGTGIV